MVLGIVLSIGIMIIPAVVISSIEFARPVTQRIVYVGTEKE